MALTTLFTLPVLATPLGDTLFGPVSVGVLGAGATTLTLDFDVTSHTDPAVGWNVEMTLTRAGGGTEFYTVGRAMGGVFTDPKTGLPSTHSTAKWVLSTPLVSADQLQGVLTVTGGAVILGGTISVA